MTQADGIGGEGTRIEQVRKGWGVGALAAAHTQGAAAAAAALQQSIQPNMQRSAACRPAQCARAHRSLMSTTRRHVTAAGSMSSRTNLLTWRHVDQQRGGCRHSTQRRER